MACINENVFGRSIASSQLRQLTELDANAAAQARAGASSVPPSPLSDSDVPECENRMESESS
jgi:hypothetical protein